MVILRCDIIGGESIVSNGNGSEVYFQKTLMPGEGIFQADANMPLWHDLTLVQYNPQTKPIDGFRDILGLDMNVIN